MEDNYDVTYDELMDLLEVFEQKNGLNEYISNICFPPGEQQYIIYKMEDFKTFNINANAFWNGATLHVYIKDDTYWTNEIEPLLPAGWFTINEYVWGAFYGCDLSVIDNVNYGIIEVTWTDSLFCDFLAYIISISNSIINIPNISLKRIGNYMNITGSKGANVIISNAVDIGSVNAIRIVNTPTIAILNDKDEFIIDVAYTNTSTSPTLKIDGLNNIGIYNSIGGTLTTNEIPVGRCVFQWDASWLIFLFMGLR
jgi:hypothetical protein